MYVPMSCLHLSFTCMMCCFGLVHKYGGIVGVDFSGNNGRVIRKCTKVSSVISIFFRDLSICLVADD
jgi:hypothetical protein